MTEIQIGTRRGPETSVSTPKDDSGLSDKPIISALADEQAETQKKAFTKYFTAVLAQIGLKITDLYDDLRDGKVLVKLLELLSGDSLPETSSDTTRINHVENVNIALNYMREKGVLLENIGADTIVDGHRGLTLSLSWTIILKTWTEDTETGTDSDLVEKKSAEDLLLSWCQTQTTGYSNVKVVNFTSSWSDGLAFNAIIHKHRPDLIQYDKLNSADAISNLNNAFRMAENNLGIASILDAEDVNVEKPEEKSIMTYVMSLYRYFKKESKSKPASKEIQAESATVSAQLDRETTIPDTEIAIPDRETTKPDRETVIPDRETAITDRETAITDRETAIPDRETTIPDRETAIPDRETAIPDRETAIPDRETAIPEPKMVELIKYDEKSLPIFKMDVLEAIIYRGEARDLPMIAISICGAHNSGKSFLLHVLLMYFRYQQHPEVTQDWTQFSREMKGGHWVSRTHTNGVWIWDTPIVIPLKEQKVAVLLLDCQGSGQTADESIDMLTTYMAMRISHVQLYNVEPDWNISHLRMLELLVDALASSQQLAFTSIVCVIRDWVVDSNHGERPDLLKDKLKEMEVESGPLASFTNKTCFTLPSPGEKVLEAGKDKPAGQKVTETLLTETNDVSEQIHAAPTVPLCGRYDHLLAEGLLEAEDLVPEDSRADGLLVPEGAVGADDSSDDELFPEILVPEGGAMSDLLPEGSLDNGSYSTQVTELIRPVEAADVPAAAVAEGSDAAVGFKISDVDSKFTDAVSKLCELVTDDRLLNVSDLKKADDVISKFKELSESFSESQKYCSSGAEACEHAMVSGIFSYQEVNFEKEMREWLHQDETTVDELPKWKEDKLAESEANLSHSRALKVYRDTLISKNRSSALKEKSLKLYHEFYFIKCGMQLKNLAKELKNTSSVKKEACNAKISALYKQLQQHINHVCCLQGPSGTSSCLNQQKSFISGLAGENGLAWIEQFNKLFTHPTGTREIRELQFDSSNDLAPESLLKPGGQEDPVSQTLEPGDPSCPYQSIPEELVAQICKLCRGESVGHAVLVQSPTNYSQAAVIGENASYIQDKLQMLQQNSPSFTLTARDCPSHLLTNLCAWHVEQQVAQSGTWQSHASVTCGLIVSARDKGKENPSPGGVIYAVVPAHLILTQEQCEKTASTECSISQIRQEVESQTTNRRYIFKDGNTRKDLVHPPLINYRHWYRTDTQQASNSRLFMSDVALLRLPDFQPKQPSSVVKICPVDMEMTVDALVSRAQPVFVGKAEGRLTACPRSIGSEEKNYGLHLAFIITSKDSNNKTMVLTPGDSGLTVYFKGKDGGLIPVGMFVGAFSEAMPLYETQIYQAVLLTQVLRDIERDYPHQVSDIVPLDTCP